MKTLNEMWIARVVVLLCAVPNLTLVVLAAEPKAPATKLCVPTELIAVEAFAPVEPPAPPKGSPGWRDGIGQWIVEGGILHGNELEVSHHEAVHEYVTDYENAVITAQFKLGGAAHIGFVCRDVNRPNNHLGRVMITTNAVWLQKMSGIAKTTKKEVLQTIETKMDPNEWYSIVIEVSGDQILARVGPHTLQARHERFKDLKGRVGMVAKGKGAEFKNIAIWKARPNP